MKRLYTTILVLFIFSSLTLVAGGSRPPRLQPIGPSAQHTAQEPEDEITLAFTLLMATIKADFNITYDDILGPQKIQRHPQVSPKKPLQVHTDTINPKFKRPIAGTAFYKISLEDIPATAQKPFSRTDIPAPIHKPSPCKENDGEISPPLPEPSSDKEDDTDTSVPIQKSLPSKKKTPKKKTKITKKTKKIKDEDDDAILELFMEVAKEERRAQEEENRASLKEQQEYIKEHPEYLDLEERYYTAVQEKRERLKARLQKKRYYHWRNRIPLKQDMEIHRHHVELEASDDSNAEQEVNDENIDEREHSGITDTRETSDNS